MYGMKVVAPDRAYEAQAQFQRIPQIISKKLIRNARLKWAIFVHLKSNFRCVLKEP